MALNLSALRTVIGEKISPFFVPPKRADILAEIRDEEERKRREARVAVGLSPMKQEELRRPTGGVKSILDTKITPEESRKIIQRELEYFGVGTDVITPGRPVKERTGFVGIPFLGGAVKKIIPKGLEGIVAKLRGLDKPTFLRQFEEGITAQNLTTRDTARNVEALIKKSGFKDIGAFYDTHAPKVNTAALKTKPMTPVEFAQADLVEAKRLRETAPLAKDVPDKDLLDVRTKEYFDKYIADTQQYIDRKVGALAKDLDPLTLEATPDNALIAEAKKYKTAEEFVNKTRPISQAETGKPIVIKGYHGTPDGRFLEEFDPTKKGYFKDAPDLLPDNTQWNELYGKTGKGFQLDTGVYEGISFSDDFRVAKSYSEKPAFESQNSIPMVVERSIVLKNPKVIDVKNGEWKMPLEKTIKQAKEEGYDGIIFKNIKDNYHPKTTKAASNNVIAFNPDQIKTKSQLTDFYERATKASRDTGIPSQLAESLPVSKAKAGQAPQEKIVRPLSGKPTSPSVSEVSRKSSLEATISDGEKKVKANIGTPEERVSAKPEEMASIKDILNRSEMSIHATTATGKPKTARDLAQEITDNVKKQNEKLKDPEIAKLREKNLLGAETIDEIILRKRGIITDKEAIERAKTLRGTIDDVLNLPKGSVPTKEQLTAISQIVQGEREINLKLIQLIDGGGVAGGAEERALIKKLGEGYVGLDEHEILNRALAESTLKLKKAEIVLLGMRGEIGRSLQGTKLVVDAVDSRMRIVFGKIKKLNALEQQSFLERLAKEDVKDDKKFVRFLEELQTADFFDKVAEFSVSAKLWNPTTHAVNFFGNALRMATDIAITSIVSPTTIKADLMGARVGLSQGLKNVLRALTDEGYASQLSKYIEEGGTAPAIGGKLGQRIRTPFRALGAGDELFRAIAFQRSLYRQAYKLAGKDKNGMEALLKNPTLDMLDKATEQAKRLTFQEDMGEITVAINNFRTPSHFKTKTAKTGSLILRFFLPFLKTPTNLLKQSVDFSPLGGLKNFSKIKEAAKSGDTETVGRLIGESIVGTAIAAYVVLETLDGNITGGAPQNPSEKDRFYREKKLPYAIKIGDSWYQYKRVDPFSTVMGLISDATTLSGDEDLEMGALVNTLINQMSDKTYLSGMADFMKLFTGEPWEREYALKNMILGATMPSFFGHAARSIDPTVRKTDTILDRIKSQIPFVSESLPAKVDVLGENIERANKGLNYFFNPIQSEIAEIDPITKHLMDIDKTISIPQDYFSRDGKKYELSAETYARFTKEVGTKIKDGIEKLMRDKSYQRLSEDKKADEIDKLRKDTLDDWKDAYVGKSSGKKSLDAIFGKKSGKSLDEIFK